MYTSNYTMHVQCTYTKTSGKGNPLLMPSLSEATSINNFLREISPTGIIVTKRDEGQKNQTKYDQTMTSLFHAFSVDWDKKLQSTQAEMPPQLSLGED